MLKLIYNILHLFCSIIIHDLLVQDVAFFGTGYFALFRLKSRKCFIFSPFMLIRPLLFVCCFGTEFFPLSKKQLRRNERCHQISILIVEWWQPLLIHRQDVPQLSACKMRQEKLRRPKLRRLQAVSIVL